MRAKRTWRNLMVLPFVVTVRVPLLYGLVALAWLGRRASRLCNWLNDHLPGLEADD